jgi:hypothetical protein
VKLLMGLGYHVWLADGMDVLDGSANMWTVSWGIEWRY